MYYIFNKDGNCVCVADYELDKDDLASREEIAIESNEIFDIQQIKLVDGEITVPAPSLDELKAQKLTELKTIRDTEEVKPIAYNGNLFDYDDKARERMRIAQQALEDNNIESQLWTCADNVQVLLTVQDFKNINTLAAQRSGMLHVQYNKLKEYINSLTTTEEVEVVTFDTEVPEVIEDIVDETISNEENQPN